MELKPKPPKSMRLHVTAARYIVEAAVGLLEPEESLAQFYSAALLGEVARRRALRKKGAA